MLATFEAAEAAIAPIYDASDILVDPQLEAIGAILSIDDAELGPIKMSNVISRLSETRARSATPAAATASTRRPCSASWASAGRACPAARGGVV